MAANEDLSQTEGEALSSLSQIEKDTLAEFGNLTMGAASSTLSMLLGDELDIRVDQVTEFASLADWAEPFPGEEKVLASVIFTRGLETKSYFIFRAKDAVSIANLMMGTGSAESEEAIADTHYSAIGEAMSQMMSAAATHLSQIIATAVDVDPTETSPFSVESLSSLNPTLNSEGCVQLQYTLSGTNININLVSLISRSDAAQQIQKLSAPTDDTTMEGPMDFSDSEESQGGNSAYTTSSAPVTVQPVQFAAFDNQLSLTGEQNKNLELVMDIGLSLTVELGRTEISIKEILELTRGSVVELERIAGEPVDLLANGKLIAKGEVVVIEDNFGLRINSIVAPADRLRGLSH